MTNQEQYQHLVLLLKSSPQNARGFTAAPNDEFWEKATAELNSLGPPERTPKEWRKVVLFIGYYLEFNEYFLFLLGMDGLQIFRKNKIKEQQKRS